MNRLKLFVVMFLILTSTSLTLAGGWINGSVGLVHTRSAWVMQPGHLTLYAHTNFYGKVGKISDTQSIAFWEVT